MKNVFAVIPVLALSFSFAAAAQLVDNAPAQQQAPATTPHKDPWKKIPIPPLHAFKPTEPTRIELANGLVIFLQEDHELPFVSGTILIRGGSRDEPANKVGLVSLYGETWRTSGTATTDGDTLDDRLEAKAASIETSGGGALTTMSWSSLKPDFDSVFASTIDLLLHPAFKADKLSLARQQIETGISRRNDDASGIAARESSLLVYGPASPFAREPEYATVDSVTVADLKAWHDATVHPNNMIVAISGDFDPTEMEAKLRAGFGPMPRGKAMPKENFEFPGPKPGIYFVDKNDVNQSNVIILGLGTERSNPDLYALSVMNEIFSGGFGSRLFQNVRTRLGLAYAVGGSYGASYDHPGVFEVSASTKSATTVAAAQAMLEEIGRLKTVPPTGDELRKAKEDQLNSFIFRYDSPDKVLNEQVTLAFFGYPKDFLEKYKTGIESVTAADVSRVANKYIDPAKLAILVVGNKSQMTTGVGTLGKVTDLDITIPGSPQAVHRGNKYPVEIAWELGWLGSEQCAMPEPLLLRHCRLPHISSFISDPAHEERLARNSFVGTKFGYTDAFAACYTLKKGARTDRSENACNQVTVRDLRCPPAVASRSSTSLPSAFYRAWSFFLRTTVNLPFDQPVTEPNIAPPVANEIPKLLKRQGSKRSSYATPIAFIVDYFSICAGSVTALMLYKTLGGTHTGNELANFLAFSVQYTLAFVLFGKIHSLYNYKHNLLKVRDTAGILRVSLFCFLLLSVESLFSQIMIPRLLLVLSCAIITIFVLFEKHAARRIFARWKSKETGERRVIILGSGSEARRLFSFLLNSPDLQLRPVGFFEEQPSDSPRVVYSHDYQFKDHATVYTGQLDANTLRRLNISEIYMADPTLSPQRLAELAHLAAQHSTPLSFVAPVQVPGIGTPVNFQIMDGLFVTSYSGPHESSFGYVVAKRILDITVCIGMFLVSLPIWVVAALWVKLSSEGPIFFEQERIGHKGVPFKMLKFRSMYVTAPKYGRSPEDAYDPRITPAGRFLRKTSLDELPQLINVLLGQMSLVGPRPEMPYVVSEYTLHQKQRLEVPQGLTGMWQLSADRKFAIHQSIEYDLYYIENRGIFLDLAILLHTAVFAMKGI